MNKDEALNKFTFWWNIEIFHQIPFICIDDNFSRMFDYYQLEDISKPNVITIQNYVPTSLSAIISVIRYFFDAALEIPLSKRQSPNIQYVPIVWSYWNYRFYEWTDTFVAWYKRCTTSCFSTLDWNAKFRVGKMVHLTLNGKFSKILTAL